MPAKDASLFRDARTLVTPSGITPSGTVLRNVGVDALYQAAVQTGEAKVMTNGALLTRTDPYHGRAAKSSFYVRDPEFQVDGLGIDDLIAWGDPSKGEFDNLPTTIEVWDRLRAKVVAYLSDADGLYVTDAWSGRTPSTRMGVRVITARPSSALFAKNIFLDPEESELADFDPLWTILHAPAVTAAPEDETNGEAFILVNLGRREVLIGGTRYNGQIKKSMFCVQNFRLPLQGILTMHAGASEGRTGGSAVHAGLSGTGKTTLSNTGYPVADDQIVLEIDAEGDAVISNMEGGQYAKTENLRRDKEPETFDAIGFGTTAENIWVDDAGKPDYANTEITANGRVGYPLAYVDGAKPSGTTKAPGHITFLTADGFGVLPPLAKLSIDGGKFHFAAGFTSKMPGTEKGVSDPKPTFSAFFGKPFMPLKPKFYTDLLAKLVETHGTQLWLVNTGWLGPNRPGRRRVDILVSKAIINAVRDDQIDTAESNFWYDERFKLWVPKRVPGVDPGVLDPRNFWEDMDAYHHAADELAAVFQKAMGKMPDLPEAVLAAGPAPLG